MKTTSKIYFQFPLSAFAYGENWHDRLNDLISYCGVETGHRLWRKLREKGEMEIRSFLNQCNEMVNPKGFDIHNHSHVTARLGLYKLNISSPNMKRLFEGRDRIAEFESELAQTHGASPLVRLRADLVWEAFNGGGIQPNELAILAAIYSVIGDKRRPVRITQEAIRRRALGYKNAKMLKAEIRRRSDKAKPLSDWKLRSTINSLTARRFFARATVCRRKTYYSHRLSESQLRDEVFELNTRDSLARLKQRTNDRELTERIRNTRALANNRPLPHPDGNGLLVRSESELGDLLGDLF